MELSVIVPAYNEGAKLKKNIIEIEKYLESNNYDYEIIIVDDGSKDNTVETIKCLQDVNEKIKILVNDPNRGKGYSVKRGMLEAKKEYAIFMDADLATPLFELEKFKKFSSDNDVIIASRNLKESNITVTQPVYRRILGKGFSLLAQMIAVSGIRDTQCGFKMFSKRARSVVFSRQTFDRFGFDVEILHIAKKHNFSIKELPVTWMNDSDSRVSPIKDSVKMFLDLLRVRLNSIRGLYK
jgi:dolichyl-phosphate beta-glucosyltransferase